MSYKDSRNGLLNTEKAIYQGVGQFDTPKILPMYLDPADVRGRETVGFNYVWTEKRPEEKILHCFLDDYQFERVWRDPDKYIERLRQFKYVIAPDFSLYVDHPKAVQIFNHYRKHWTARYWQDHGIKVIPCICWSDADSFGWCFDGEPTGATVCVSTIGGFGNHGCDRKAWLLGYAEMHRQLKPTCVILFGGEYADIRQDCEVAVVRNEQLHRKQTLSQKPMGEGILIPTVDEERLEDNHGG